MPNQSREFWSRDRRFGFRIPGDVVSEIRHLCMNSDDRETGGIIIGRYSEDLRCAEVTDASGLPADSRRTRNWLVRGIMGLTERLRNCWNRRREYYLGDWHFHPSGDLTESQTDVSAMVKVSHSQRADCPEPISVVVGLGQDGSVLMSVNVFTRSGSHIALWQSRHGYGSETT